MTSEENFAAAAKKPAKMKRKRVLYSPRPAASSSSTDVLTNSTPAFDNNPSSTPGPSTKSLTKSTPLRTLAGSLNTPISASLFANRIGLSYPSESESSDSDSQSVSSGSPMHPPTGRASSSITISGRSTLTPTPENALPTPTP
jgi:hypothetical protein